MLIRDRVAVGPRFVLSAQYSEYHFWLGTKLTAPYPGGEPDGGGGGGAAAGGGGGGCSFEGGGGGTGEPDWPGAGGAGDPDCCAWTLA